MPVFLFAFNCHESKDFSAFQTLGISFLQFILSPFSKKSEDCFTFFHLLDLTDCLYQTGNSIYRP